MIYSFIVGLVLGHSDIQILGAALLGLGAVLSKGISEVLFKTNFITDTPSPYVLYVMNLRQNGDFSRHPWFSYLLQMLGYGMIVFVLGFAITRWVF